MSKFITHEDYAAGVLVTESCDFAKIRERMTDKMIRIDHAFTGIATEAGEIQEAMVKAALWGRVVDYVNLIEELGDMYWYIHVALDAVQVSFENKLMMKSVHSLQYVNERITQSSSLERAVNRLVVVSGMILDRMKKYKFYGKELTDEDIILELGNVYGHMLDVQEHLGVSTEEVMTINNAKLRKRFGDKFTEEAANNRNLDAEREVLEGNDDNNK